jgi:hypothetical protein
MSDTCIPDFLSNFQTSAIAGASVVLTKGQNAAMENDRDIRQSRLQR